MSTIARIITLDLKMNSIIILTLFLQALIAYKCPSFQRGIAASSRPGVLELSSNTFFMLHLFPSNPAARSSLTPKFSRTFSFSSAKNYDNLFMSPLYNSLLGVNTDRRTVVYEMVLPRDLGFDIVQGPGVALVGNIFENSEAKNYGIQSGDRIIATSATAGDQMWEHDTVDSIQSALSTRFVMFSTVKVRFERSIDNIPELLVPHLSVPYYYTVTLSSPIGLNVASDVNNKGVFVSRMEENGSAALGKRVQLGDAIVAMSATWGDRLWEVHSVEGFIGAIKARTNQEITLRLKRMVKLPDILGQYLDPSLYETATLPIINRSLSPKSAIPTKVPSNNDNNIILHDDITKSSSGKTNSSSSSTISPNFSRTTAGDISGRPTNPEEVINSSKQSRNVPQKDILSLSSRKVYPLNKLKLAPISEEPPIILESVFTKNITTGNPMLEQKVEACESRTELTSLWNEVVRGIHTNEADGGIDSKLLRQFMEQAMNLSIPLLAIEMFELCTGFKADNESSTSVSCAVSSTNTKLTEDNNESDDKDSRPNEYNRPIQKIRNDKQIFSEDKQRSIISSTSYLSTSIPIPSTSQSHIIVPDLYFQTFSDSSQEVIIPSPQTIVSALRAYSLLMRLSTARKLFDSLQSRFKIIPDTYILCTYLHMLVKHHQYSKAEKFFWETIPDEYGQYHDKVMINIMMYLYAKQRRPEDALRMYDYLQKNRLPIDLSTYGALIKALLSKSKEKPVYIENVFDIITSLPKLSPPMLPDVRMFNQLFDEFGRQCNVEYAHRALRVMSSFSRPRLRPDLRSYSHLIKLACNTRRYHVVMTLHEQMRRRRLIPTDYIYGGILQAMAALRNAVGSVEILAEMFATPSVQVDIRHISTALFACVLGNQYSLAETLIATYLVQQRLGRSAYLPPSSSRTNFGSNFQDTANNLELQDANTMDSVVKQIEFVPDIAFCELWLRTYWQQGKAKEANILWRQLTRVEKSLWKLPRPQRSTYLLRLKFQILYGQWNEAFETFQQATQLYIASLPLAKRYGQEYRDELLSAQRRSSSFSPSSAGVQDKYSKWTVSGRMNDVLSVLSYTFGRYSLALQTDYAEDRRYNGGLLTGEAIQQALHRLQAQWHAEQRSSSINSSNNGASHPQISSDSSIDSDNRSSGSNELSLPNIPSEPRAIANTLFHAVSKQNSSTTMNPNQERSGLPAREQALTVLNQGTVGHDDEEERNDVEELMEMLLSPPIVYSNVTESATIPSISATTTVGAMIEDRNGALTIRPTSDALQFVIRCLHYLTTLTRPTLVTDSRQQQTRPQSTRIVHELMHTQMPPAIITIPPEFYEELLETLSYEGEVSLCAEALALRREGLIHIYGFPPKTDTKRRYKKDDESDQMPEITAPMTTGALSFTHLYHKYEDTKLQRKVIAAEKAASRRLREMQIDTADEDDDLHTSSSSPGMTSVSSVYF